MAASIASSKCKRAGLVIQLLGAAVILSACSASPSGVLTTADVPKYLDVSVNPSASASISRQEVSPPGCRPTGVAAFGMHLLSTGLPMSVQIVSTDWTCTSISGAKHNFAALFHVKGGHLVPMIGDEAALLNSGSQSLERSFAVEWRRNNQLGAIAIQGPPSARRLTAALAELLARRAAASS